MVEKTIYIAGYDEAAWTASTADLRIDNGPLAIESIVLSWDAANTSATATTVANVLAGLNPFKVTHEARKIAEIRGDDLYALNQLWLENNPLTIVASAATSAVTRVNALRLPVNSKAGANTTCLATKATITNGGSERLSLCSILREATFPTHFEILTTSYTPAGTGSYLQAYDKTLDGELVGFLFFSTTIPTATAEAPSVDKVRIKLNGNMIKDLNSDLMYGLAHDGYNPLFASPADATILDNYLWLPFLLEPPKKGDRVTIEINAGTADAIRIIEVVKVA